MAAKRLKIFDTKYFGVIIGISVFVLFVAIGQYTSIFTNMEQKMLDVHFNLKNEYVKSSIEVGVSESNRNPNISDDILIVGIDFNSLTRFGKWPFPRHREAQFLDSLTRIQYQNERESAVFLDLFFIEPDAKGYDDVLLINSMYENGRVFLETVLDENEPSGDSYSNFFDRQDELYQKYGTITAISGDVEKIEAYTGLEPPLKPYARAVKGYGHANFREDEDEVYRRVPLILRSSRKIESFPFRDLRPDYTLEQNNFERLEWIDKNGVSHSIDYPVTEKAIAALERELRNKAPLKKIDTDNDGEVDDTFYEITKYQDNIVPAITLSLATHHFNRSLEDIHIVLGEYIRIPSPQMYNTQNDEWEPYRILETPEVYDSEGNILKTAQFKVLDEIRIPIDEQGKMLINFAGPASSADPKGYQTFPVRSFAGYAANPPSIDMNTWPRTKALANKIVMVGAFARGIADDEKPTPYGLMYGVEIHANALNTILMNKFITRADAVNNLLILFVLLFFTSVIASRMATVWSLIISSLSIVVYFFAVSMLFDRYALILDFAQPAIAVLFCFISIVVYRVMTEERDKKRIRVMFGKYVSPGVVDHLMDNPPELGGVDKHLTVFFSDVRGFTTLSESMTPQELLNHLNVYFTKMTDIILSYNGTLDKYVGDEIMCFWGAPLPQEDHALLACRCALEQSRGLKELNENWPEEKRIDIGIGINSGIMTVGNVGSEGRMNYTLMGDPVNLGARLEGTNKQYGTQIIVSENTYGLVKDHVIVRELDNIRVKGKNKPVVIYELVDCN